MAADLSAFSTQWLRFDGDAALAGEVGRSLIMPDICSPGDKVGGGLQNMQGFADLLRRTRRLEQRGTASFMIDIGKLLLHMTVNIVCAAGGKSLCPLRMPL